MPMAHDPISDIHTPVAVHTAPVSVTLPTNQAPPVVLPYRVADIKTTTGWRVGFKEIRHVWAFILHAACVAPPSSTHRAGPAVVIVKGVLLQHLKWGLLRPRVLLPETLVNDAANFTALKRRVVAVRVPRCAGCGGKRDREGGGGFLHEASTVSMSRKHGVHFDIGERNDAVSVNYFPDPFQNALQRNSLLAETVFASLFSFEALKFRCTRFSSGGLLLLRFLRRSVVVKDRVVLRCSEHKLAIFIATQHAMLKNTTQLCDLSLTYWCVALDVSSTMSISNLLLLLHLVLDIECHTIGWRHRVTLLRKLNRSSFVRKLARRSTRRTFTHAILPRFAKQRRFLRRRVASLLLNEGFLDVALVRTRTRHEPRGAAPVRFAVDPRPVDKGHAEGVAER